MNQTRLVKLPPVPKLQDPAANAYLAQLTRALTEAFQAVYTDTTQGAATLTTFSADPTAQQLENNRIGIRTDAGNEALCVFVGGTLMKAALA